MGFSGAPCHLFIFGVMGLDGTLLVTMLERIWAMTCHDRPWPMKSNTFLIPAVLFFSSSSIPPGTGGVWPVWGVCLICRFFTAANVLQRGNAVQMENLPHRIILRTGDGKHVDSKSHHIPTIQCLVWCLHDLLVFWVCCHMLPPNWRKNAIVSMGFGRLAVQLEEFSSSFPSAKGQEWIWVRHCWR